MVFPWYFPPKNPRLLTPKNRPGPTWRRRRAGATGPGEMAPGRSDEGRWGWPW